MDAESIRAHVRGRQQFIGDVGAAWQALRDEASDIVAAVASFSAGIDNVAWTWQHEDEHGINADEAERVRVATAHCMEAGELLTRLVIALNGQADRLTAQLPALEALSADLDAVAALVESGVVIPVRAHLSPN
jgi:hypothetical protein